MPEVRELTRGGRYGVLSAARLPTLVHAPAPECRAGELLRTMNRAQPRTHPRNSTIAAPLPKFEDLGVTKKQSATLATVPKAVLDQLTAPPAPA